VRTGRAFGPGRCAYEVNASNVCVAARAQRGRAIGM